jgi:hypothetical protein
MGNSTFGQETWGAGIFRGRNAPEGSVYDAINALVADDGDLFKRGVTALYSASDSAAAQARLHPLYLPAVDATRILTSRVGGASAGIQALNGSLSPVTLLASGPLGWSRPAMFEDIAVFAEGPAGVMRMYGGSLKTANYLTGTVTVTKGSKTVTGAGTSWLANADAGMIFSSALGVSVVDSVNSDTSITLTREWEDATAAGASYVLRPTLQYNTSSIRSSGATRAYVAAGSGLLLFAVGSRVHFLDTLLSVDPNEFHELPSNVNVIGMESRGTSAWVFTTRGVWEIGNLYLDAVDDAGNLQRPVEQINKDVVLLDDYGIAAWDSSVVVPAIDDVYLASPGFELRVLSEGIRPLWRSYVKAGYALGFAAVHRGHYIVSVMNGTTVVDTLVCRLDRPFQTPSGRIVYPWTRWAGHAGGPAYAELVEETSRSPKLLGLSGLRVTNLTGCMDATSASGQDADSTTPVFTVDSNDYDLGPGIRPNTAEKVRYVYETTGGTPTVDVSWARGAEGASFTAATLKRGGGSSDGLDYSAWYVGKKAERIRFRFQCSSQVTSLILRRLEVTVRQAAQN